MLLIRQNGKIICRGVTIISFFNIYSNTVLLACSQTHCLFPCSCGFQAARAVYSGVQKYPTGVDDDFKPCSLPPGTTRVLTRWLKSRLNFFSYFLSLTCASTHQRIYLLWYFSLAPKLLIVFYDPYCYYIDFDLFQFGLSIESDYIL